MRIFTDASTSGKISGIAFVITDNYHNIIAKRAKPLIESDNNAAELTAILFALEEASNYDGHITILSDSQYALNCIKANHCRKFERPIMDLIQYYLANRRWAGLWIKGHKDNGTMLSFFNRQADHMASNIRKAYVVARRREKHFKNKKLKRINNRYNDKQYD